MKKLSKKALNKSFLNWFYGHLTCFSQEHMQTFGYMCAMLPIIQELYDTNEEQTEKTLTYSTFFNTEPQVGSIVVGITAGMEEARANGEPVDDETINGIRAGLMGPLAGIGDSLVVGTLLPILLGIALGLSGGGSPLGAIFYILVWNIGMFLIMRFMYFKGYELGGKAVEVLVGEKANAIRDSIIMLGTMVIGGVTASFGTLGDIMIAEKGARIGFAGRRVIEQTIKEKLPADFQTAEYLLKYGQIDSIVTRAEMKEKLSKIIAIHNMAQQARQK